ncbi:MAG: 50S ribosomal protein L27, partial [Saprospiraceae bacterium]|nr:50S ribosomal protein L27 [Saprospiraceae bacterium]
MAHKKGVGSSDNGRDSHSKRLGVKLFGGQYAKAGNIVVRQRGTKFHAGENAYLGKDFTIHANVAGIVSFRRGKDDRCWVSISPMLDEVIETAAVLPKSKPASATKANAKAEVTATSEETPAVAKKETAKTAKPAIAKADKPV